MNTNKTDYTNKYNSLNTTFTSYKTSIDNTINSLRSSISSVFTYGTFTTDTNKSITFTTAKVAVIIWRPNNVNLDSTSNNVAVTIRGISVNLQRGSNDSAILNENGLSMNISNNGNINYAYLAF